MSKEEEIHYKAVIAADNQEPPKDYCISAHADHFNGFVEGYVEGYHQAEKDLELTWKDIKIILDAENDILCECNSQKELVIETYPKEEDYYGEILKRFNKERKEK